MSIDPLAEPFIGSWRDSKLRKAHLVDDEQPVRLIPHDPKDEAVAQAASELFSFIHEKAFAYAVVNGVGVKEAYKRVLEMDDDTEQ